MGLTPCRWAGNTGSEFALGEYLNKSQLSDRLRGDLPRSPTGRIPQWVIDERMGVQRPDPGWREAPTYGRQRRRKLPKSGRSLLQKSLAVVVLAAVAGSWVYGAWSDRWTGFVFVNGTFAAKHPGMPTPGHEASSRPLHSPPTVANDSASYRFVNAHDGGSGQFVAYDPCRPIHYVTRPQGEPDGGQTVIAEAVAQVSRATGLVFVDDGATDEAPSSPRQPFQPDRYGDRWAPVLIGWETPDENADFAADVVGLGGSTPMRTENGPAVYVTGQVELDGPQFSLLLTQPGGQALARAVVEHELGHLVGLDHTTDASQLMFPEAELSVTDYGAGDLTGLAMLGGGVCAPKL
ncbi:MAG: Peptidase metallopeptidase [Micrococcaceae bacterium]|nr:Peptidase metallopeptidase [Micrococcaceae bacterium]